MSESIKQNSVRLKMWGFKPGESAQLDAHAHTVEKLQGMRTGEIIWSLGITTKDEVERLLKLPRKENTLLFLQNHIKGLQSRSDEVLCIQAGVAYISEKIASLSIHPLVRTSDDTLVKAELIRFDVMPMLVGETTILLFSDFEKMLQFKAMGKSEKVRSGIYNLFSKEQGFRPELHIFKMAVAEHSLYNSYRQNLSDSGGDSKSEEEGIQSISHQESSGGDAINTICRILDSALKAQINDVALIPDRETGKGLVHFRINQRLMDSNLTLTPEERITVSRVLQARSRANPSNTRLMHPADGKINFEGRYGKAFLRINFMPLENSKFESELISIRILPRTEESVDLLKLNIPNAILKELSYYSTLKDGLFLVCGPTNSGKSTTIAGMLGKHNDTFGIELKRIAVEQPVERLLSGVNHVDVSQFKYGNKTGSAEVNIFAMALRAIVRQDPDVVFVGEVRDQEGCHVSIDAANTGHLVLTTTHANSPLMGFRRLASFLDRSRLFDLVTVLRGILTQRLSPTLCPDCSHEHEFTDFERDQIIRFAHDTGVDLKDYTYPETHRIRNVNGCGNCTMGLCGMTPIHGLLKMTPAIRNKLLSPNEADWLEVESLIEPELTLFNNAFRFFKEGKIQLSELVA